MKPVGCFLPCSDEKLVALSQRKKTTSMCNVGRVIAQIYLIYSTAATEGLRFSRPSLAGNTREVANERVLLGWLGQMPEHR